MSRTWVLVALAAVGFAGFALHAAPPASAPAPANVTVASVYEDFLADRADQVEAALPLLKDALVPADDKNNVAFIRQAIFENRPLWWKKIKAGGTVNFNPFVWGRALAATYDPKAKNGVEVSWTGNKFSLTITWPSADMDNTAQAEHGFTKGELQDLGVWMNLGNADAWSMFPPQALQTLNTEAAKNELSRFLDFRGNLTGVHYSLPRARRWGLWLFCSAYTQKYAAMPTVNSRKAVAAIFIIEVLSHPDKYPSLKIPRAADTTEETVALAFKDTMETHSFTVTEDRMIHDALKFTATTNELNVIKNGRVNLPQGLAIALDPDKDKPLREKRDAWVKQVVAKLPK